MIPIPQYPLYSATVPLLGGTSAHYFLNEAQGWSLDINELKRAVHETRHKGIDPRALTILNPGASLFLSFFFPRLLICFLFLFILSLL
jgi:aspartate/methionine/tyrosine aminotransferase